MKRIPTYIIPRLSVFYLSRAPRFRAFVLSCFRAFVLSCFRAFVRTRRFAPTRFRATKKRLPPAAFFCGGIRVYACARIFFLNPPGVSP